MAYQPFDRNPSGIVFFGTAATDKLYDSTSTFTYDVGNNALKIPNGGYIGSQNTFNSISIASNGNVTFAQNLSVGGNLTVNGTTTTVNSTVVTIQDPIIVLGSGSPNTDDNKDRGIAFNFHTGSVAKSGFFGYDDSTGGFTFIPDATFSSEVISGTAGWATFAGVSGDLSGNATTATTLQNTRTFSVSGETLASAQNFNGGANVTLTTALDKSAINNQVTLTTVDATNDFILIYDASANGSTGGLAKINRTNFVAGLGAMSSFTISDGTNTQTISDAESLFFRSGPAISFTVSATDQVSGTLNAGVAGNGLNMTSQVLAVGAGSGITVGADQVSVTDGSGILVDINGVHANLISYTAQSVAANAATTTASRTYPIQVDSSDKLVVNVPWTDTSMTFTISDGIGGSQTIVNSDTLTFRSGPAINFNVSATDQVSGTLNSAVAGNGLNMTSQVLAVGAGSGITVGADQVSVNAGSGLSLDANGVHVNAGTGLLNTAAGLQIGIGNGITGAADAISVTDGSGILVNANGVHSNLVDYTVQTVAAAAVTTTSSRTYAIQVNSSDQLVVNVPWADTNTTYTASSGLVLTGTAFSVKDGSGILIDSNGVHTNVDDNTIKISNATDQLYINNAPHSRVTHTSYATSLSLSIDSQDFILCDGGAGGITISLPSGVNNYGRLVRIKKADTAAGAITISGVGYTFGETNGISLIDGANTYRLYHQYESVTLLNFGYDWYVV